MEVVVEGYEPAKEWPREAEGEREEIGHDEKYFKCFKKKKDSDYNLKY